MKKPSDPKEKVRMVNFRNDWVSHNKTKPCLDKIDWML